MILVEIDPYSDSYHLRIMGSMIDIGKQEEALKYGVGLRSRFLQSMNESPSPEVESFINKLERRITKESLQIQQGSAYEGFIRPLIGQKDLLSKLTKKYQAGGVVFLRGDTGSGKSRIVSELCAQLDIEPKLFKCECFPQQQNIPYQPLVRMLRSDFSPDCFERLSKEEIASLQKIGPELPIRQISEGSSPFAAAIDSQGDVLEVFSTLFSEVACTKRIILLLDDAHWSDESTLATMTYLMEKQVFPRCGLLLVTYDPSIHNPALSKFQSSILNRFTTLADSYLVAPLDDSGIVQLAASMFNVQLTKEMTTQVRQFSGGNPLFIKELLSSQYQLQLQHPTTKGNFTFGSSPVIQTIIHLKLENLSPVTKSIIYTSAILGVNIDQELLEKASFFSGEEIVDAIEELEAARILQLEKNTEGSLARYTFTQNAFREGIISSISASRKRLIHKRVAHALANHSLGNLDKTSATLAEHYEAGGELDNAFVSWVAAGSYAKRMQSTEEELSAYGRAEKLLISTEMQLSDPQIMKLFEPWISTLYMTHDIPALTHIARRLFSLGKQRGSSLLTGYALFGLSDTSFSKNDYERSPSLY